MSLQAKFLNNIKSELRNELLAGNIIIIGFSIYFLAKEPLIYKVGSATLVLASIFISVRLIRSYNSINSLLETNKKGLKLAIKAKRREIKSSIYWYILPLLTGMFLISIGELLHFLESNNMIISFGFFALIWSCIIVFVFKIRKRALSKLDLIDE